LIHNVDYFYVVEFDLNYNIMFGLYFIKNIENYPIKFEVKDYSAFADSNGITLHKN